MQWRILDFFPKKLEHVDENFHDQLQLVPFLLNGVSILKSRLSALKISTMHNVHSLFLNANDF